VRSRAQGLVTGGQNDDLAISSISIDERQLIGEHLVLQCQIETPHRTISTYALVDSGATGYAFIDSDFARKNKIPLSPLKTNHTLEVVDGRPISSGMVTHLAKPTTIIQEHHIEDATPMFVTRLGRYPLVLGIPWLRRHRPAIDWERYSLTFPSEFCQSRCIREPPLGGAKGMSDNEGPPSTTQDPPRLDVALIGAAPFHTLSTKPENEVHVLSLYAIDKALNLHKSGPPSEGEIKAKLPVELHDLWEVFSKAKADELPPHRPYDHKIILEPGREPPFGPLYSMSRDELEVLRQWLTENLNKGFIRASSSPCASPVMFVKKPDGGLRFCVDYRKLNAITIKNRYPLPLIQETLARLSKAKYFTKIDIIAAFNRLRIAEGHEYLTAFRTRYGLFESLVLPFGLTGGPATFQSYINDTLREYLDVCCTAYMDDVLIYGDNKIMHTKQVRAILEKLREAGLQADIRKCEFYATEVKYLGLIISRGSIKMDPAKIEAIVEWEVPHNVQEVQSFVGFANFYRRFIENFSDIVSPLTNLTRKGVQFEWLEDCARAFQRLKEAFTSAPILKHFDPDLPCRVETDASDFASGGILSQLHEGSWLPVAYFSRRHLPAERNYEIYDKELMAIVRCFENWRAELEGTQFPIEVLSDHKNLEWFMTTKQLSRRQARWSEFLSRFNFQIVYRSGKLNNRPDALSRRPQDHPRDTPELQQALLKPYNLTKEVREQLSGHGKSLQLLADNMNQGADLEPPDFGDDNTLEEPDLDSTDEQMMGYEDDGLLEEPELPANPDSTHQGGGTGDVALSTEPGTERSTILERIDSAYPSDDHLQQILNSLRGNERNNRNVHFSLAECEEREGRIWYREKLLVPDDDGVRELLFKTHHEEMGHRGQAQTYSLLHRNYYWRGMDRYVRQKVRQCQVCQLTKHRNIRAEVLLKPLPVPRQRWRDISIDFIDGLPSAYTTVNPTQDPLNAVLTVTDRLTKDVEILPCTRRAENDTFFGTGDLFHLLEPVFLRHGAPVTIVSDRDTLLTTPFWDIMRKRFNIRATMSSSYHPQTDGQSERTNQNVERILRALCFKFPLSWPDKIPMLRFIITDTESATTKVTPFFATHGYHPRMGIEPAEPIQSASRTQEEIDSMLWASEYANHMEDILEELRAEMLFSQEGQERSANRRRGPAPVFHEGDRILLKRMRKSKKLDPRWMGPFTISKRINALAYQLREIPGGARLSRKHGRAPVYHVSQLKTYHQPDRLVEQENLEAPDLGTGGPLAINSLIATTREALSWDNGTLRWDNLPQHISRIVPSHWPRTTTRKWDNTSRWDNALRQNNTLKRDNALRWDRSRSDTASKSSPTSATMAAPDCTRRLDQPIIPIDPALLEDETSGDNETSEGNHPCSYCKLLRLKDCNVRQTTPPARCVKCIQRDYPCTSAHPTGEYGRKHRLPRENRPPRADNLCEQRTPWAPISKMRIIEGRCEFRLQVRKRNNIEAESRDFFDWQCLIPFLEQIHNYSIAFPRAGARYPQALKEWLEVWKECRNNGGIRAPPPDWDKATPAAPAVPIVPPSLNPPGNRKRGRAKAAPPITPGRVCAIGNCTRSFETGEELQRHEAGHSFDRILEEVAAIRQELRLERLERVIKEQETSRLLHEVLRCLNENKRVEVQMRRPRDQDPTSTIAPYRTDTVIEPAERATTRRVINMDGPPTTITQPSTAITTYSLIDPRLEDERGEGPDQTGGAWLIPNHRRNHVPNEFICQWSPCDTTFDTYGELVQHIQTHRLLFRCQWNGCNDMVPVMEALEHLTHKKHQAHRDKTCRWNNCLQQEFDGRKLNGHLSRCMKLQHLVFKCPWKDCDKHIKQHRGIKDHLLAFHWKLRKWD